MNLGTAFNAYKKIIETSEQLEQTYKDFWTNIHFNDAYVFYKHAIDYYRDVQNNKVHNLFGNINKKLFIGTCQYIELKNRLSFINDDNIKKVDLDDLCNLTVQIINIMDSSFFELSQYSI